MKPEWKPIGTYRTIPLPPRPMPKLQAPTKFRLQVKKPILVPLVVPVITPKLITLETEVDKSEPESTVVGLNSPL